MLVIDVAGTTRGTQYDHLSVGGAAALGGTLAVVQAARVRSPAPDAFAFLTSALAHRHVRHARRRAPAGRQAATGSTTRARRTSARAWSSARHDLVVTDCDDPALAAVTEVTGDLIVDGVAGCDARRAPGPRPRSPGDLIITDLRRRGDRAGRAGSVAGDLTITRPRRRRKRSRWPR